MSAEKIKGALFVLLGAASYGILATIVKYANGLGNATATLIFFQFLVGVIILSIVYTFSSSKANATFKSRRKLMTWGASLGSTSLLYYLSIQYIPVSIAIILLMQNIWMGIVLESVLAKKMPSNTKLLGTFLTIIGTLLATNIFNSQVTLDWRGLALGIGAGVSFTISMYASSTVEQTLPSQFRSLYFVLGGLILITTFFNTSIIEGFSMQTLYWGSLLAIFGTVLPPLLFTSGIPKTGLGISSILSSAEIPVSILSATIILGENTSTIQWIGVLIIVASVVIVNTVSSKPSN